MANFSAELRREIDAFAQKGLSFFRGTLIELDKYVTGDTLASTDVRVQYGNSVAKILYYAEDSFTYHIEGRKAGTPPPIDPIMEWVDEIGIDASPYAVQWAIGEDGTATAPVPFFEEFEEKIFPELERFLQSREIQLILFQRLDKVFNNRRR